MTGKMNRTTTSKWLGIYAGLSVLAFFISVSVLLGQVQPKEAGEPFTVGFYNVENLFDYEDDPTIDDDEFLPKAPKYWNAPRYRKKLNDIGRVIDAIPGELPVLMGLSEIENRTVLLDLTKRESLSAAAYHIVHRDSPDGRGIDVALLYQPDRFEVLHEAFFTTPLPAGNRPNTREVLYAKGVAGQDTLHVMVNHWPSRYGGQERSEPNRIAIAQLVREKVDSILARSANAKIIVMGDLNDYPNNQSVQDVLGAAVIPEQNGQPLFNLTADAAAEGMGSYFFQGKWGMLDQIIVSWSLLNAYDGLGCAPDAGKVMQLEWMMYIDKKGRALPDRTYGRDSYYGGISDHLPVYATFKYR